MKRLVIAGVVLLAGISGEVMAVDCSSPTKISGSALTNLIPNKTVCAVLGAEKWQEWHSGSSGSDNNLIDWKKGSSSTVDPSGPVGKWSTSSQYVTYNYGTGGTFSYEVHGPSTHTEGATYTFCGVSPAPTLDVKLWIGQVPCGF